MWAVFAFTAGGFLSMYVGLGLLTSYLVRGLFPALGVGRALGQRVATAAQVRAEVRHSLVSIFVFGWYGVATVQAARLGWVSVDWQPRLAALPLELLGMVLWNDLHFYLCHRLLHTGWLYRKVHIVHHRSVPPTPWATFSFHWAEATLLGGVLLLAMPFYRFNVLTLVTFPLVSLLLNNLGHMNHDLVPNGSTWRLLAASRRHALHHSHVRGNFGFLLPIFDFLFRTRLADDHAPERTGGSPRPR